MQTTVPPLPPPGPVMGIPKPAALWRNRWTFKSVVNCHANPIAKSSSVTGISLPSPSKNSLHTGSQVPLETFHRKMPRLPSLKTNLRSSDQFIGLSATIRPRKLPSLVHPSACAPARSRAALPFPKISHALSCPGSPGTSRTIARVAPAGAACVGDLPSAAALS